MTRNGIFRGALNFLPSRQAAEDCENTDMATQKLSRDELIQRGRWHELLEASLKALKKMVGARAARSFTDASFFGLEREIVEALGVRALNEPISSLVIEFEFNTDGGEFDLCYQWRNAQPNSEQPELHSFPSLPEFNSVLTPVLENSGNYWVVADIFLSILGSAMASADMNFAVVLQHHDADDQETVRFTGGSGEPISYPTRQGAADDPVFVHDIFSSTPEIRERALDRVKDLDAELLNQNDPFLLRRLMRTMQEFGGHSRVSAATLSKLARKGHDDALVLLLEKAPGDNKTRTLLPKLFMEDGMTARILPHLNERPHLAGLFIAPLLGLLTGCDRFSAMQIASGLFALDASGKSYVDQLGALFSSSLDVAAGTLDALAHLPADVGIFARLAPYIARNIARYDWFFIVRVLELAQQHPDIEISPSQLELYAGHEQHKIRIAAGRLLAKRLGVNEATREIFAKLLHDRETVVQGNVISAIAECEGAAFFREELSEYARSSNSWLAARATQALAILGERLTD